MIQPASRQSPQSPRRGDQVLVSAPVVHLPMPLLQEIVQRAPMGVAVIDRQGVFLIVNPAFCGIYGYAEPELIGRSFTSLIEPSKRQAAMALHRQFFDGAGQGDLSWDLVQPNGGVFSVVTRSMLGTGDDGQPCRVVYALDITEGRRTEAQLHASQQYAQSVLDGLGSQICVIDENGSIITVNRAWREFGASNDSSVSEADQASRRQEGANYLAVCDAAAHSEAPGAQDAREFAMHLRELLAGQRERFELEYPCHTPQALSWYTVRVSRMAGSEPPRYVVAHINVTALKLAQENLRYLATTDDLTGVANRRQFLQALGIEFERARRRPSLESCVLSLDVDHFKRVNDTWGHAAGDAVLQHITRLVVALTRPIDIIGRMGGEEFSLLLPDTCLEQAVQLGQRLGSSIAQQPLVWQGAPIPSTVSIGVTDLSADDLSVDAPLARADAALYEAKHAGRDTTRWRPAKQT